MTCQYVVGLCWRVWGSVSSNNGPMLHDIDINI